MTLIELHNPKGDDGRLTLLQVGMLLAHLLSNWIGYADPKMDEALNVTAILR